MNCPIIMRTIQDVERVSHIAATSGVGFTVTNGHAIIDPRSILGLITMMGKEATLVAPDGIEYSEFMRLVKRMGVVA